MSSNTFTVPGMAATRPREADSTYELMLKDAPSTSGPSVITAQYISTRWPSGRGRLTRQIPLSVLSMVSTSASAVTNRAARPTAPSRLALPANWLR